MNRTTLISSLTLIALISAAPAFGQTVYKCPGPDGKPVYQQTSCTGETGTALKIETGNASEVRNATDEETGGCLHAVKIIYKYKDPDSLRVEGGSYVKVYPSGRKDILFNMNGKNSYGAYAGAKPTICKYKANGQIEDVQAF
jgi:hypothetical protein